MLKVRNDIPEKLREQKSNMMWENLMQTELYQQSDIIFTYVSANTEAQTLPFFHKIWQDGKKIAVPIIEKNRNMDFVYLNTVQELTVLKWGILAPEKENSIVALPTEKSLFIVPALAIDQKGNRIGYGGGYYDTYFSKYKSDCKIGFIFSQQQLKKIESVELTDIPLNGIVTENEVLYF